MSSMPLTNGNVKESEGMVGFRDSKVPGRELHLNKSIEAMVTKGPMKGNRIITVISSSDETTKVNVSCDVKLSGALLLFRGIVRERIAEGSRGAR